MRTGSISETASRRWRLRAVALSAAAGLTHMFVAPLYFEQWVGYGAFFVATAVLQVMGAMALAVGPPSRFLYWAGIVGNGFVVLLWTVTRTAGIPFVGPAAGQVQPVGVPDLAVTLVEVVLVVHLAVLLRAFPRLDARPLVE